MTYTETKVVYTSKHLFDTVSFEILMTIRTSDNGSEISRDFSSYVNGKYLRTAPRCENLETAKVDLLQDFLTTLKKETGYVSDDYDQSVNNLLNNVFYNADEQDEQLAA